jgi:hypothetical protein
VPDVHVRAGDGPAVAVHQYHRENGRGDVFLAFDNHCSDER